MLVAVLKNSKVSHVEFMSHYSDNFLAIRLRSGERYLDFGLVYRPHEDKVNPDAGLWPSVLQFSVVRDGQTASNSVLVGDFNFQIKEKVMTMEDERQTSLYCMLHNENYQYMQKVKDHTHKKKNVLDLVFSRPTDLVSRIEHITKFMDDYNDHCILVFQIDTVLT